MKLNSKCFIWVVFFALVAVVESHAAGVFAYGCAETADEDGLEGMGPVVCDIGQYATAEEAIAGGFSSTFTTWNELVEALSEEMGWSGLLGMDASGLEINLKTDLDMGGFVVADGDTACVNEFNALDFGGQMFQKTLSLFDGQKHIVKNFCKISTDGDAGFFKDLTGGTVRDLVFEGAYVKATGVNVMANAAVVANAAMRTEFQNVAVKQSRVIADGVAAGLVANYSGERESLTVNNLSVDVELAALTAGGLFGTVSYSGNPVAESVFSVLNSTVKVDVVPYGENSFRAGGLVGSLNAEGSVLLQENMANVNVADSRNSGADNSVGGLVAMVEVGPEQGSGSGRALEIFGNKVELSFSGIGNLTAGGVAGYISRATMAVRDSGNVLNSVKLDVELDQAQGAIELGGGYGMIRSFNSINVIGSEANVDISVDSRSPHSIGGYIGTVDGLARASVSIVRSKVNANLESENASASNVYMGGVIGRGYETFNEQENYHGVSHSADNDTLTLSMKVATSQNAYVGGLFGRLDVEMGNSAPSGGAFASQTVVRAHEGKNLIECSAKSMEELSAGYLVGYLYAPRGQIGTLKNYIDGDINVSGATIADTSIGGIVGYAHVYRSEISNNILMGDIMAPRAGFIVGKLESSNPDILVVEANYHYGTKDANVKNALGSFVLGGESYAGWRTGATEYNVYSFNIKYNYRNAVANGATILEADGPLTLSGEGTILAKVPVFGQTPDEVVGYNEEYWYSGVLDTSSMKSRLFAYVMNKASNELHSDSGKVEWESDKDGLPFICGYRGYDEDFVPTWIGDNRTAYKVQINLGGFYDILTEADKGILADYLYISNEGSVNLVGITDRNGNAPALARKIDSLSVDLAVVMESMVFDLADMHLDYDMEYLDLQENQTLVVAYEMADPSMMPYETLISMDKYSETPLFVWPKVARIKLLTANETVPLVYVKVDEGYTEMAPRRFYINCKQESMDNCVAVDYSASYANFREIAEMVRYRYYGEHTDTLHLVYGAAEADYAPKVYFSSNESRSRSYVTAYGYRNDELAARDTTTVGGPYNSGYSSQTMASKYGVHVEKGFSMKSWKVDFWMGYNVSVTGIVACTEGVSEQCANVNAVESSEKYMDAPASFTEAMVQSMNQDVPPLFRWTVNLESDEYLDMDSLVRATSYQSNNDASVSNMTFLVQVTPELKALPYKITFDARTDDYDVYLTDQMLSDAPYSRESGETATLPVLLATDACFLGWSPKDNVNTNYRELNGDLLESADVVDSGFALYATWIPAGDEKQCPEIYMAPMTLKVADYDGEEGNFGSVVLWQKYRKLGIDTVRLEHGFVDGVLNVPVAVEAGRNGAESLTFHVESKPEKGYKLARLELTRAQGIVSEAAGPTGDIESETIEIPFESSDTTFNIMPLRGMDYTLNAYFGRFKTIVFDKDREGEIFYAEGSDADSVDVVRGGGQVELPAWIYTVDSCVLGWALESGAETYDYRVMTYSDELYENVSEAQKLYAVWGDAEKCVESARYVRVSALAENGNIELLEGDDALVHKFGPDGTMILPPEQYTGGFKVRAVPEAGLTLEKILLIQEGDTIPVENGEWLEGLHDGAEIRAYFVESGESVVTDGPMFYQSGNAVRFTFHKEGFVKDGDVSIRISLENDDGKELDGKEYRCITDACDVEWERFPLAAGFYLFTASVVRDGRDSLLLERDFEVASKIEVAGEKSWQMLSLANVDMDELSWDGDEKFYWWAEDRNYGKYWQYQELTKGQVPDPERGYWYHSIEGRPLVLMDSAFADDITWNLTNENGGWNLVANPYGWYLNLGVDEYDSDEPEEESEGDPQKKRRAPLVEYSRWNPEEGQYVPVSVLKPYEAVWAKLNRSLSETVEIAAKPEFDKVENVNGDMDMNRSLNRRLAKAGNGASFSLQAVLSDGRGKKDSWNVLAVGPAASQSEEPPAGIGDHVNLSILEGGKRLMKSVKASGENAAYEWKVDLMATSARTGFLSLAGVDGLESRGLSVYVTVDGNTVRMREGETLKVALSPEAKVATVFVGSAPKIALVKTLAGLKAVQAGATLQVDFDAGAGLAGSAVRVDVLDLKGNVVRRVALSALAGLNHVTLDTPKPGIYMLRVRAGSQMKAGRILVK